MRCFADTNVLVAVVTEDDDRADAAIAVLNDHEMHTSVFTARKSANSSSGSMRHYDVTKGVI